MAATHQRKMGVSYMPLLICLSSILALVSIGLVNGHDDSVDVRNDMTTSIGVHCQSRDDDLGPYTLAPNQMYGFGFYENFFGTTLFSCNFVSPTTNQRSGFEAWGVHVHCLKCLWSVRQDGFYVMEKDTYGAAKFMHPWLQG